MMRGPVLIPGLCLFRRHSATKRIIESGVQTIIDDDRR